MSEQQPEFDNFFSFDNFKKWMNTQESDTSKKAHAGIIGTLVESKVPAKRLVKVIDIEKGNEEDIVVEFCTEGGTVVNVEDKTFLVEVASGSFRVLRHYIKRDASS